MSREGLRPIACISGPAEEGDPKGCRRFGPVSWSCPPNRRPVRNQALPGRQGKRSPPANDRLRYGVAWPFARANRFLQIELPYTSSSPLSRTSHRSPA